MCAAFAIQRVEVTYRRKPDCERVGSICQCSACGGEPGSIALSEEALNFWTQRDQVEPVLADVNSKSCPA